MWPIFRSVIQISGQLFQHLIMKKYQIWWLLALGVPPKSWVNFFTGHLGNHLGGLRSLRVKNQFYKIWWYYISLECKFCTDFKVQNNLYLKPICCEITIYNNLIYKKRERYDWPIQDAPQSDSTIVAFHKEYQRIVHKRGLNVLHSYKNIFWQRGLVYHKQ